MSASDPHRSLLLDNWRGWAILLVLAGHFGHLPALEAGRFGVDLFFVLSGRLMADLLFGKQIPIGRFFQRRLARVLPVALLFVAVVWSLGPASGLLALPTGAALADIGMVANYAHLWGVGAAVTDHYWSLCVEEHSYLALAILALCLRRRGAGRGPVAAWLVGALALAMIANGWRLWLADPNYYDVYWRSDVRAAALFASVALRIVWLDGGIAALRKPFVAPVAFVLACALNTHHVPDPVKYSAGALMLAIAVNTLEHAHPAVRRAMSLRPIGWIGVVSYSIYIWQQPFFYSIERFGAPLMVLGALATGCASFYLFENPVRRWLNARLSRPAEPAIDAPEVAVAPRLS
jgi:peptidoglycan/LPS O-acetylase OafA/YrhL